MQKKLSTEMAAFGFAINKALVTEVSPNAEALELTPVWEGMKDGMMKNWELLLRGTMCDNIKGKDVRGKRGSFWWCWLGSGAVVVFWARE